MSVQAPHRGGSTAPPAGTHFEDFSIGQRLATGSHRLPEPDGRPTTGAPTAALTTFLGLASDSGVLPGSLLRLLETQWRELVPVPAIEAVEDVEATFTVTRCRRIPAEGAGSVQWHGTVRDGQGRTLQTGTVTVLLPARSGSDGSADPVERAFCTRPWGDALSRRLADDPGFRAATSTWDGSIGLRAGSEQIQLRVYRGRIIEVAARTPQGATFALEADDDVWTDLMTGPSNDFFRRAMSGDSFTVTGSAYEYLRMSKALMTLIDAARELATGTDA